MHGAGLCSHRIILHDEPRRSRPRDLNVILAVASSLCGSNRLNDCVVGSSSLAAVVVVIIG
jgi:hypothetical protein